MGIRNRTGTSKVGATSKAQKSAKFLKIIKGDPFDFLKIQLVAKYQKKLKETLWRHL